MTKPREFPPLVKGSIVRNTSWIDDRGLPPVVTVEDIRRLIAAGEWRDEARRAWNSVSHPRDCGGGGKWLTDYCDAIEKAEAWSSFGLDKG